MSFVSAFVALLVLLQAGYSDTPATQPGLARPAEARVSELSFSISRVEPIPPVYTEWLGKQLLSQILRMEAA